MPELPEVETVRQGLEPAMVGARFVKVETRRRDLRVPLPSGFGRRLTGHRITALGRRGKYLLAYLDDGMVLIVHLGMSGSLRIAGAEASGRADTYYHRPHARSVHDHVVFQMSSGVRVVFNDPRRFGLMDLVARSHLETSPRFRRMGIEPLDTAFDGVRLATLFAGRRASLKSAILDQRLIAGLGNIYACEALWRARLAPGRPAGTLATKTGRARATADRLARSIRQVLKAAIAAGGSSLNDHVQATGELGEFQNRFSVYDRTGKRCRRRGCGGVVRRVVQAGRATFYCPVCQR